MPVRVGVKSGFLNGVTVGATNFAFLGAYALALWYGGLRIRDGAYNGELFSLARVSISRLLMVGESDVLDAERGSNFGNSA